MNDKELLRAVLVWGIPFAVVVAALGYETHWGNAMTNEAAAPAKAAPAPVNVALLPEYAISGGVEARRETVDRSLFNPTRRPAPPATQTAGANAAAQHGQYTLTGTTVVGNTATAFLREVKGGKSHTVRQGEALNGVTVAEVKPGSVKLKQGDDVEELQLKLASGPKSTVQVAPVMPPPGIHPPTPPAVPGAQAAPGSGTNVPQPAGGVRPVAPPPIPNASGTPGVVSVGELLAQRRRAAAQAAAEGRTLPPEQQ
jgi:general secretion pathway protein N